MFYRFHGTEFIVLITLYRYNAQHKIFVTPRCHFRHLVFTDMNLRIHSSHWEACVLLSSHWAPLNLIWVGKNDQTSETQFLLIWDLQWPKKKKVPYVCLSIIIYLNDSNYILYRHWSAWNTQIRIQNLLPESIK